MTHFERQHSTTLLNKKTFFLFHHNCRFNVFSKLLPKLFGHSRSEDQYPIQCYLNWRNTSLSFDRENLLMQFQDFTILYRLNFQMKIVGCEKKKCFILKFEFLWKVWRKKYKVNICVLFYILTAVAVAVPELSKISSIVENFQ